MRKVFLSAAIILGSLSSYATSVVNLHQANDILIGVEEGYKEIKTSELPKAVLDALALDFNTATLERAYVNVNQEYKLHIAIQEVTSGVRYDKVYADRDGNWIIKGKVSFPTSNTTQEITNNFK